MIMDKLFSWKMIAPDKGFNLTEEPIPEPGKGEAIVKVAGCGVCHTDLSFWHYGVKTKHPLPLTLGHEISGTVVKGPVEWVGKKVIIPAVLPCGECELCKNDKSNICQNQKMPGNDFDGGFASHIVVPYKFLCEVSEKVLGKYSLEQLAVIADAISTPYQVVEKSGLRKGDLVIIIGVGGVGIYGALLSKINGAKVIALDINDDKLKIAEENGIDAVLNINGLDAKTIKTKVKEICKELNASKYMWKIFEFSGTKAGQELAYSLLTYGSVLSIVGFTMDKLEVRLSNLMAFDATLIGTWGCKPELYKDVLNLIEEDKLKIDHFVQTIPMSKINEVFKNTLDHKYNKRTVLVSDFK